MTGGYKSIVITCLSGLMLAVHMAVFAQEGAGRLIQVEGSTDGVVESATQETLENDTRQAESEKSPVKPVTYSPRAAVVYLQNFINKGFSDVDRLLSVSADTLQQALSDNEQVALQALAESFQASLEGSLKVRLFARGHEAVSLDDIPPCGFACIAMIELAYQKPARAEALSFKTVDANILLVREIRDSTGSVTGAMAVHYPYDVIKDTMQAISARRLYVELRQTLQGGEAVILLARGDNAIKTGQPQTTLHIEHTRWSVAIWTPGGVSVDDHIAGADLPMREIIIAALVLLASLSALMVYYRKKRSARKQAWKFNKKV